MSTLACVDSVLGGEEVGAEDGWKGKTKKKKKTKMQTTRGDPNSDKVSGKEQTPCQGSSQGLITQKHIIQLSVLAFHGMPWLLRSIDNSGQFMIVFT